MPHTYLSNIFEVILNIPRIIIYIQNELNAYTGIVNNDI